MNPFFRHLAGRVVVAVAEVVEEASDAAADVVLESVEQAAERFAQGTKRARERAKQRRRRPTSYGRGAVRSNTFEIAARETAWKSGPFVRRVDGRQVQDAHSPTTEASASDLDPAGNFMCRHQRLHGSRRCLGCGRTRNEIELEDR